MNKKRITYSFPCLIIGVILLLSGVMGITGCSSDKATTKNVLTVSIPPQKYLLKKIVGDKFEVNSLLAPGTNPENYDPSINHLTGLQNSRAYFRIGNIGFEIASLQKISENFPELEIINSATGISYITGTHSHCHNGHHSHYADPHIWTSVKNAKIIATNMYEAMAKLDPDNKNFYKQRYDSLCNELIALDDSISSIMSNHKGETFVVWHPSLTYFARDYELNQLSIEYEGKETSAKQLQSKIETAQKLSPKIFFFQKEYDSRQSESISNQLGNRLIPLNLVSEDWDSEMLKIANAFTTEKID